MDRAPDQIRRAFRAALKGEAAWPLLLAGSAGTGKTCAALCLADYLSDVQLWVLPQLCSARIAANQGHYFNADGYRRYEWGLWEEWREVQVGIIDEIGAREKVSDHHYETLKLAIDYRQGLPALYVTNLSLERIEALYDDRIASRLAAGTVVELSGADRRLAQ